MIREEISNTDYEFPFVLYKPEEWKNDLPLVIQLHGAGEVGNGGDELWKVDVHGLSHLMTNTTEFPALFVLPQCPYNSFWVAEIPNIYSFINKVAETYQVDRKRIYLTGLSMGGYGTWYTALRHPNIFAAIAPVCGGGMVWKANVLDMPIWAFHGEDDDIVYPSESKNMICKIRSAGVNREDVRLTILDNVGHDAWTYAYTTELIEWMLLHSR